MRGAVDSAIEEHVTTVLCIHIAIVPYEFYTLHVVGNLQHKREDVVAVAIEEFAILEQRCVGSNVCPRSLGFGLDGVLPLDSARVGVYTNHIVCRGAHNLTTALILDKQRREVGRGITQRL